MSGPGFDVRQIAMPDLWAWMGHQNRTVAVGNYRAIAREVVDGRVLGVFSSGQIVAIGAITWVPGAPSPIAWCAVIEGGIRRHGPSVIRAVKAELARAGEAIALVDEANERGKRLARLAGLVPTDAVKLGMRVWHFGKPVRQLGQEAGGARAKGAS